jgi:hypothetical protein
MEQAAIADVLTGIDNLITLHQRESFFLHQAPDSA